MTIGGRIKERRLSLNMTLEDVAKQVGVTRQTIQKYESGVVGNIPSDKIESLSTALKTTPAYLMGWNDANAALTEAHNKEYEDVIREFTSEEEYIAAVAQRIESRRQELNYSYQDLADITGLSKPTLQQYVSGSIRNIQISKLKVLAAALQVSPDWLLGWSDKKKTGALAKIINSATRVMDAAEKAHLFDAVAPQHSVDYLDDNDTIQTAIIMSKIGFLLKTDNTLNELLEIFVLLDNAGREAVLSTAKAILKLKNGDNLQYSDIETGNTKYF